MADKEESVFDQLAMAHRKVSLDDKHKAIMDEITRRGYSCVWSPDHHLLQTHTMGFAEVLADKREEFELEGVYQTNSRGSDKQTPNCFAFPLDRGGFKIYRFGQGCVEAPTWTQDGRGWTTCWFNVTPSLDAAARSLGGKPLKRGGYEFATLEDAIKVANILSPDITLDVEDFLKERPAVVSTSKDGKLAIEVDKKASDEGKEMGQWNGADKKKSWTQVFNIDTSPGKVEVSDYDNIIRCLETTDGDMAGWAVLKENGEWTRKQASNVKTILQDFGHPKPEAEMIIGRAERRPWKLVTKPFEPEYPGNCCSKCN